VLQYLVYELSEKLLNIYSTLQASSKARNKEGVIQLLVDTKFAFDVVSGRKEVDFNSEQNELELMISLLNGAAAADAHKDEVESIIEYSNRVSKLIYSLESEVLSFHLLVSVLMIVVAVGSNRHSFL
jgi:hypothetical protein